MKQIEIVKPGFSVTDQITIQYLETRTATNRFVLKNADIEVEFSNGDTAMFNAKFIKKELVTNNLTMDKIYNNLTKADFDERYKILKVHDLVVLQIYEVERIYDDGTVEEFKIAEVVVDETELTVREKHIPSPSTGSNPN